MADEERDFERERVIQAEDDRIARRRFEAREHAHLTREQAETFALSDQDIGLLRLLIEKHATPEQIARILAPLN